MACDTCFAEHRAEDTCPGVTRSDVRSIRVQVARLEAELAKERQNKAAVVSAAKEIEEQRDEAQAANAAKDVALREHGAHDNSCPCYPAIPHLPTPEIGNCTCGLGAVLSDTGEGWLEAKGACNEHPDGCPKGSHRAALEALGGE